MHSFNAGKSARLRLAGAALTLLAACSGVAQATTYTMYRDPGCGCCKKWAEHMRSALKAQITVVETRDVAAFADQRGVPAALRSCHTLIAGGYVIEGHVPAADIARLLATIDIDNSPHRDVYRTRLEQMKAGGQISFKLKPEAVSKRLIHAVESSRPKAHYYVTTPTLIAAAMRRLLPQFGIDYFARRF